MTKNSELNFAKRTLEFRDKDALDWFEHAATTFERAAQEMRQYAERAKDGVKPTDALSWAVNHAVGITPNLRLDMAVTHAKEIVAMEAYVAKLEKEAAE